MRLIGAMLIMAAGLLAGFAAADSLRTRAVRREELGRMLALMEFELGRFKTPMPVLFERLSGQLEGAAGLLCRQVCRGLTAPERQPLERIWAGALQALPPEERQILLPLGQVLGRYGAEEQLLALSGCRERMEQARDEARAARRERGRMAVGVSAAGAAALAVLLL